MHLLLACMVKLNARLRTGKSGPLGPARQLALDRAAHDINEVARNAMPSDSASFPMLPGAHDSQFWVRPLSCLKHEEIEPSTVLGHAMQSGLH